MQLIIILALLGLIIFFAQAGMGLAAVILFLVLAADIAGGYLTKFLSFIWALIRGLLDTGSAEFDELEKTKTKAPAGKKFLEESLERTGKALGKADAARAQRKKVDEKRPDPEVVHSAISGLMDGIRKLMK